MIDHATIARLADLRAQIDKAYATCGETLDAMTIARGQTAGLADARLAEAAPFLSHCANDLEALAGVVRLAAENAAPVAAPGR